MTTNTRVSFVKVYLMLAELVKELHRESEDIEHKKACQYTYPRRSETRNTRSHNRDFHDVELGISHVT
jgi:hypothetical protein